MKVIPPFRGEFGMKVWWHVPAVHAIPGEKTVFIEKGEQALYPSAVKWIEVDRREDSARRNRYEGTWDRLTWEGGQIVKPDAKWTRKRFVPQPFAIQDVTCDVVVCPRRRAYGAEKNWPEWFDLTARLVADGVKVFAAGMEDSSYPVAAPKAWDYPRPLDATIEAMHAAKLVVATDAGLAHLAVLCGRPLVLLTHGKGLVAPGPVVDETGRHMEDRYWPVKMERYEEANHTNSKIGVLHNAWYQPEMVFRFVRELL